MTTSPVSYIDHIRPGLSIRRVADVIYDPGPKGDKHLVLVDDGTAHAPHWIARDRIEQTETDIGVDSNS